MRSGPNQVSALATRLVRFTEVERPSLRQLVDDCRQAVHPGPELVVVDRRPSEVARNPQTSTTIGISMGRRR